MGCLKLTYHQYNTNASNLRVAYKSDCKNQRNPTTKDSQKLRFDYLVFGWDMPNRSFTAQSYKFGYQGSEREKEYMGGAAYTTYFRGLDPRIGRWFSPDAILQPWQSPYCSMNNDPVIFIDPLGAQAGREKSRYGGLNREGVWERGKQNKISEINAGSAAAMDVLQGDYIRSMVEYSVSGSQQQIIQSIPKEPSPQFSREELIKESLSGKYETFKDLYSKMPKDFGLKMYTRGSSQTQSNIIYINNAQSLQEGLLDLAWEMTNASYSIKFKELENKAWEGQISRIDFIKSKNRLEAESQFNLLLLAEELRLDLKTNNKLSNDVIDAWNLYKSTGNKEQFLQKAADLQYERGIANDLFGIELVRIKYGREWDQLRLIPNLLDKYRHVQDVTGRIKILDPLIP